LPSIVENVVRRHPAVADYRLHVYDVRGACVLAVEVEPDAAIATEGDRARVAVEVAEDLRRSFGVPLPCEAVPTGSMPRDSSRPRRIARRNAKHVAL
jgi:phenylacetate-coenzyme A ligase PaaK-like adenylate-forming protein